MIYSYKFLPYVECVCVRRIADRETLFSGIFFFESLDLHDFAAIQKGKSTIEF